MNQGILINGILANIKKVDESLTKDGAIIPAKNVLQITVLNEDGLSLIDVTDKERKIDKSHLGKEFSASVKYSVFNGTAYFRLI